MLSFSFINAQSSKREAALSRIYAEIKGKKAHRARKRERAIKAQEECVCFLLGLVFKYVHFTRGSFFALP
jgi:hypothetical protein